jgi:hypothetical protein
MNPQKGNMVEEGNKALNERLEPSLEDAIPAPASKDAKKEEEEMTKHRIKVFGVSTNQLIKKNNN